VKYLLDSNIIVHLTMGSNERVVRSTAACDEGDMATSAIAYAQVSNGSSNEKPPVIDQLQSFAKEVPVLNFDYKAEQVYGTPTFKRHSFDRLIAAHALLHDLIIVTHNEGRFADVPGVNVENWTV